MSDIRISNRRNLLVKVFVFGYPLRGESILVLFVDKQNNKVLYSIVIDSFKYRGVNKTVDIMSSIGLEKQKIDMLIWSHPDYDHTYGIDSILNNYCDADTMVVLPLNINGKDWHKVSYNRDDKKIMQDIINLTKGKKFSHETISVCRCPQGIIEIVFFDDLEDLPVKISALSPHGRLVNGYLNGSPKKIHKNALSLSIMIEVGEHKFLFMSDIENAEISEINSKFVKDPVFIKIPHHTSKTSILLLKKIIESSDERPYISCTTVYRRHKLPEEELLGYYKGISYQVDCTGFAVGNEKVFGYIEYTFDLYDEKVIYVSHKGHSKIVDNSFRKSIPWKNEACNSIGWDESFAIF